MPRSCSPRASCRFSWQNIISLLLTDIDLTVFAYILERNLSLGKVRFFLGGGGGGLGPQRGGSSVKASTKRGGPYLM